MSKRRYGTDRADRVRGGGKFRKSHVCDACGKPVGTDYLTDDEVCGLGDGPGFFLCSRKSCASKLEGKGVEERRAIYTAGRLGPWTTS